jgi:Helix-turn-helix domain
MEIAEIEAATKIRSRFLGAIENEEWGALPGDAYARSFIRAYADHLGLDGARLATMYPVDPVDPVAQVTTRRSRPGRRAVTATVVAGLIGVVAVLGLVWGGGGGSQPTSPSTAPQPAQAPPPGGRDAGNSGIPPAAIPDRVALQLESTALVWVCVLDQDGHPLVEGEEFPAGAEIGRFSSGSFTVAFGNGGIVMRVDGKQIADIPDTGSPIGYSIDSAGKLTPLPEGERPTCL